MEENLLKIMDKATNIRVIKRRKRNWKNILFVLISLVLFFTSTGLHAGRLEACIENRVAPIEIKIDFYIEEIIYLESSKFRRSNLSKIRKFKKYLNSLNKIRAKNIELCLTFLRKKER